MIRFGINFDSSDYLKVFISELSKFHSLDDYEVASGRVLSFTLKCKKSFDAYMLIGEMHTILRNLHYDKCADIYSVSFCNLID